MPYNIPIEGDDAKWKRAVDQLFAEMQKEISQLQQQLSYLQQRVK